jgi:hypothetical protein
MKARDQKQFLPVAMLALSIWLAAGVSQAEDTSSVSSSEQQEAQASAEDAESQDSFSDEQEARAGATLNCPGREIYILCHVYQSDCQNYCSQTTTVVDGCQTGGIVPVKCGSSFYKAVSYRCP